MGLDLIKRRSEVWRQHRWQWTVWSWGQNIELISKYSHGQVSISEILDLVCVPMLLPPLKIPSEIDSFTYNL